VFHARHERRTADNTDERIVRCGSCGARRGGREARRGLRLPGQRTVHSVDVALGKPPTFRLGHGDVVEVKLVPSTEPRYRMSGPHGSQRNVLAMPPACGGCDNGRHR
jgi:hypothetical protein